jgi:ATP-dependent RNA/DNA helicase IGHMBP2
MTSTEELKQLLKSLQIEKEEEIKTYDILIKKTSLNDRIKAGACWYPVQNLNQGWSLGDHPFILIERQKLKDTPHKFKAGAVVSIFAEEFLTSKHGGEEKGVIHFIDKNKMKIILYGTELPNWIMTNKIGIQLSFDERSYVEMERAVNLVLNAKKSERLGELREILLGYMPANFQKGLYPVHIPTLNLSQNQAVNNSIACQDIAILHGPPGTGKTTTLVETIRQISKYESAILVCAPSNPATDLLTERLAAVGLKVVRVGNISRVDESLLQHTVEGILNGMNEMNDVRKMRIEAASQFKQAEKFKRNFGSNERDERREARNEARQLLQQARQLEDYIIEKLFAEADVITCTLVGAMNSYIEKKRFRTVVIDEAAQALEPATWIPILKADRVILAGDPFQLPPTVKSMEAAKEGLSITLLEKGVARIPTVQLLNTQYRMHEQIMGFSNKIFYNNELKAADMVARWGLVIQEQADDKPISFIDTAGCGFEEQINEESRSYYNPEEYFIIRQHLDNLLFLLGDDYSKYSIGIISPYKEQIIFMKDNIEKDFDHFPNAKINVDTIDSFQGQERDVIYISMVRSNDRSEIGFLKDSRRMNVAMTRAKKKLIVIGDSATLASFPFYRYFLDYVEQYDAHSTAWEWL